MKSKNKTNLDKCCSIDLIPEGITNEKENLLYGK